MSDAELTNMGFFKQFTGGGGTAWRDTAAHKWLVVLSAPVGKEKQTDTEHFVPSKEVWTNSLLFVMCLIHGHPLPHYAMEINGVRYEETGKHPTLEDTRTMYQLSLFD